ncbi:hypothetical protein RRG08_036085 [Elysia crispata]|uniref:Uncharacterized protein n=1 Tax=Elysia crispata TaxID=231223 RepID=A0AAE1AN63_9GAST|nr:hypothetical protein RRG08_036085 [Elysia crispata]
MIAFCPSKQDGAVTVSNGINRKTSDTKSVISRRSCPLLKRRQFLHSVIPKDDNRPIYGGIPPQGLHFVYSTRGAMVLLTRTKIMRTARAIVSDKRREHWCLSGVTTIPEVRESLGEAIIEPIMRRTGLGGGETRKEFRRLLG